jgi:cation diffusion facilitator family transporter
MHTENLAAFCHSHSTVLAPAGSERRTWLVVFITGLTMLVELVAGYFAGSMALVADGWHMATHVGALSLAGLAYWYARRHATSRKFTFGVGKIYALAGYTNAILLGVVALAMIVESVLRLREPVKIDFNVALPVAVVGLVVNLLSMLVLGSGHHHGHVEHEHHDHDDDDHDHHEHPSTDSGHAKHEDHNMRGAFLHVAADAFTSVLAIGALLAGMFAGWTFLDPVMGIVGALVILRWGFGLIRSASRSLLDVLPSQSMADEIKSEIESIGDSRVSDLHLWELSPGRFGCIVSVVSSNPLDASEYRKRILEHAEVNHLTVEVTRCAEGH